MARDKLIDSSKDSDVFIKVEYIRCTDFTTEYQVLTHLSQELGQDVPNRGWTKAEIIKAFNDIFKTNVLGKKLKLIVILDEVDILLSKDGDGLLYTLASTDNVSILLISNYLNFKKFIKPRASSRLSDKEFVFFPYNANRLNDILEERSKLSFNEKVFDDDVIPLCSAIAAKEVGDVRYALNILKTAGEIADDRKSDIIHSSYVIKQKILLNLIGLMK